MKSRRETAKGWVCEHVYRTFNKTKDNTRKRSIKLTKDKRVRVRIRVRIRVRVRVRVRVRS